MSFRGSPQLAVTTLAVEAIVAAPFAVLSLWRPAQFGGAVFLGLMLACVVLAVPVVLALTEAWEQGKFHRGR